MNIEELPWGLLLTITFIVGASIGSFLNVVIYRMPKKMYRQWQIEARSILEMPIDDDTIEPPVGIAWPPSSCPGCNQRIRPWHNLPIVGYLMLGGKCFDCKSPISLRYPFIEAVTGFIAVFLVWTYGLSPVSVALFGFSATLLAAAMIDADTTLLPDELTLPLMWAGLLISLWSGWPLAPGDAIVGAAVGYLSLWSIYQVFKLITGKEGMGYGDFKLLAAIGAWTGWQELLTVILLSSVVGTILGVLQIVFKRMNRETPMPFGPYLAAAGWLAMMFGPALREMIA
ncbi:MAG: prepilin peptidase [Gammaproteobacteria bacterium]|nr:prepilin peptidase [Gammaproteobacteria bacterium]